MSDAPPTFNPKDTILKGPSEQQALLQAFAHTSHGHSREAVLGACSNLIIAAIRQSIATRVVAEQEFDMLCGRTKTVLLQHYDGVTGLRKTVFPFHQQIQAPLVVDEDQIFSPGSKRPQ